jgi:hypothetical protein
VIHISETSSLAKNDVIKSILVLKKTALLSFSSSIIFAPDHIRAPLMSIPMKFRWGKCLAIPTVYSPFPQASSRVMGLLF